MSLRLRSLPTLLLALSASAALTVACGDDKGTGDEHSDTEPQVCKDISNVCHDADGGSGMANECHEQAHAGDAAVCEMIHDECIALCNGGTGTETGTTMTTTMSSTTDPTDTDTDTNTEDEGTTHAHDESTTHQDAESTDGGTGHDSGSETSEATSCDILGSGCHDNKTPEGMECHEIGHTGDVAACDKALEMCSKICGI